MKITCPKTKKRELQHKIGIKNNSKCWTKCGKLYDGNKLKVRIGEDESSTKLKKCKKCFA